MDTKLKNNIKIFSSLKFKLTFLYSIILFAFAALLVLSLNVYINIYMNADPAREFKHSQELQEIVNRPIPPVRFNQLSEEERERIRQIREEDLKNFQIVSALSLIPLSILSFVVGYYISSKFLEPLNTLKKEFDSPDINKLGKTIPIKSYDEIGVLIESYNNMSVNLKNAFEEQREFMQDASHELRTPLTIIKTNLDVSLQSKKQSLQSLRETISNSIIEIDKMTKLLTNLFTLSNSVIVNNELLDMKILIQDIVRSYEYLSKSKNKKIQFINKLVNKKLIYVDKDAITRVLSNIIENSLKYALNEKETVIKITLYEELGNIMISIKDNGKGIPKEYEEKVFQRFFRIEKSRNRELGGNGLGLSIVKKLIEEHGWVFQFKNSKNGVEFILSIDSK